MEGPVSPPWAAASQLPRSGQIVVSEDVVYENVGDELVLLDLQSGTYFGLNSVGRRIWELLIASGDASIVLERLGQEYDAPLDQLGEDLKQLLQQLLDKRLISLRPEAAKAEPDTS